MSAFLLHTDLFRVKQFIKEVLYRVLLRYFTTSLRSLVQPRESKKETCDPKGPQSSCGSFESGPFRIARDSCSRGSDKKACLVVCLWLLHFSPVASWRYCRNMTLKASEVRPSDRHAPVAVLRTHIPQSQFFHQYESLRSPSSSEPPNIQSFHSRSVVLRMAIEPKRRSCSRWDVASGSFVLRRYPRPTRWWKDNTKLPKRWYAYGGLIKIVRGKCEAISLLLLFSVVAC